MPRKARVVLPNCPHHIVQRGHNRQAVFADPSDFERYLADLRELKDAFGIKVHAFCLMTNHVHLLLAPPEDSAALAQLMKRLAGRMTRYRNRIERRTGTLWEGRYKSSAVQTDAYLLACCRYIELNPVRAGMVARPAEYFWSSYRLRMLGRHEDNWLERAAFFDDLAHSDEERSRAYRAFVDQGIPTDQLQLIRNALQRGQLTGSGDFIREVEQSSGLRIETRGRGRPRRNS
ncbi:transposase [Cupriavidus necator]|uniref:Transposase n=1 Tax=Cupriavidus necator TaxID=106590 RepID=A0A1U9UUL2_CUPNE|nr:transposase [Cupriavidus necator]AQV96384.1 transposase [Cupriavidus necator]